MDSDGNGWHVGSNGSHGWSSNGLLEKRKTKTMDAEQLREHAHKMVDFIADYYKNIETFPVLSQVQPGYLSKLIPDYAPQHPESLESVLDDVEKKILVGLTHWQSPSFFAYYPNNSSIPSFLGEMLSSGLNIVGFTWISCPAATELEIIVLDCLAKLLHLPPQFLSSGEGGGVIHGTACEAVLAVIVAARDRTLRKVGRNWLGKLVVYASDQTHSSFQKGCMIGGIHPENYRFLKADSSTDYQLSAVVLSEAVENDIANGLIPFFLCATVGTTSSAAIDPLPTLGKIAKKHGMWFHVDAAYGGNACICPEFRHYIDGVEEADSFNMNAHKWLLTNFDCSPLWIKDKKALIQSLCIHPEYLDNHASQTKTVVDFKDLQIPLSRRFRSLKLWMVLRMYGVEELQNHIRNHVNLAQHLEKLIVQDPRFEIAAPRKFALLCFRLRPPPEAEELGNKLNSQLLDAVNLTGKMFITHTVEFLTQVLSGKYTLRLVIGATLTEERHVIAAWKVLQEEASALLATF